MDTFVDFFTIYEIQRFGITYAYTESKNISFAVICAFDVCAKVVQKLKLFVFQNIIKITFNNLRN